MDTERDVTRIVASWLRTDEHESADRVLDDVLALLDATPQRRSGWPARRFPGINTYARFAIAAAAVVVVAAVSVNLLPSSGRVGGPPASDPPSPSPSGPADFIGLPPEGTTPSDPEPGELVLRLDGSITVSGTMWVYADGRLLRWRLNYVPEAVSNAFIGLEEQRLTPSGVAFLRSQVISTGLFDSDLVLAREGNAPFLEIKVRNGDRLIGVTWAWRGISGDAPVATPEQESALRALNALLTDPRSWPSSAWEDQAVKAYVPSEYGICFRVFTRPEPTTPTEPIEPARIWALLPGPAEDLLLAGDPTPGSGLGGTSPNCSRVTTDDARAVARILENEGIRRAKPELGGYWLRFLLRDQGDLGDEVWINFAPVLPHGEATWLGPG